MTVLDPRFKKNTCSSTQDVPEKGRENEAANCREAPRLGQDRDRNAHTQQRPPAQRGLDPQLTAEGLENREPRTRRKSRAARPGIPGSAGYPGPFKATAHTRRCRCAPRTLTPLQQQDINCSRVPNANCNNFCRELFFFTLFIVENLGHKECKSLKNSSYVFSIDIVTRRRRA